MLAKHWGERLVDLAGNDGRIIPKDKKTYQQDPANYREALRELRCDEAEGADIVIGQAWHALSGHHQAAEGQYNPASVSLPCLRSEPPALSCPASAFVPLSSSLPSISALTITRPYTSETFLL